MEQYLFSNDEDEEALLQVPIEGGGGVVTGEPGRFEFNLNPYVDRQSERLGVRERHYTANVRQVGQFQEQQNVNAELVDAIHQTLQNLIRRHCIPTGDRVYFGLASNRLNNNLEYQGLPAGEWLHGSDRVDQMLEQMGRMLNSSEQFEINDSFQLSFTHVRQAPQGSGKRKMKPGHSHPQTFKRLKESVITIKNKDSYCAARAIVTAKAKMDSHSKFKSFQRGTKLQYEHALLLHPDVAMKN